MVRLLNFDCGIRVEGALLKEFTDPQDLALKGGDPPTAIVYVKAEEEKKFGIEFKTVDDVGIAPAANGVCWNIMFNGDKIGKGWISEPGRTQCVDFHSYQDTDGRWLQRNFVFSKLDVTEDGNPKDKKAINLEALGEITINVRRYRVTGPSYLARNADGFKETTNQTKSVHEKQLKGHDISHTVGMSQPIATSNPTVVPGVFVDPETPYAIIKFRYRSERALKGLGLIPRTPLPSLSPEPHKSSDAERASIDAMSREDLEAELLRLRRASQPKVKPENAPRRFKREHTRSVIPADSATQARKKRKAPKVIDLTGDSD